VDSVRGMPMKDIYENLGCASSFPKFFDAKNFKVIKINFQILKRYLSQCLKI